MPVWQSALDRWPSRISAFRLGRRCGSGSPRANLAEGSGPPWTSRGRDAGRLWSNCRIVLPWRSTATSDLAAVDDDALAPFAHDHHADRRGPG